VAGVALVALVATGGACAGGSGSGSGSAPSARLPNGSTKAMAHAFDAKLKPLGWRIQRSELEHQELDPKHPAPGRRHLAVYVRPTRTPTNTDYLKGLADVTRVFLPSLFERYADLASFDVCEEPTEAQDPSDEPKPVTQVLVTRAQSEAIDWGRATPADIAKGGFAHPNTVGLYVSEDLRHSSEWSAMVGNG
jgi:hypothetical protein